MNPPESRHRLFGSNRARSYSASADAARRATRARDHLERKRAQERRRRSRERSQADRKHERTPLRSGLSAFVLVVAASAGIFAAAPLNQRALLPPSSVERIDVQGASVLTPDAIVRAAESNAGNALQRVPFRQIIEAVEAEPWIESARALRLPTGTLVISVVERNAIAIWKVDPTSAALLVDDRGQRFEGALEPAGVLPLVRGGGATSDDALPSDAVKILTAIDGHPSLADDPRGLILFLPDFASARSDDEAGYVLQLGEDGPRVLIGRQFYSERLARLAALIESGESTFLGARLIDLRYADRAVLRAEPISG